MKGKQQIWNRSSTQSHHTLVSLIMIIPASDPRLYIWATTEAAFTWREGGVFKEKKIKCVLYGIYIWNEFSAEDEKATALPDRSSQENCGSEQYHTCVHPHNGAILGADKVQKKGLSLPGINSIHPKLGRVVSGGFLCFFLLNFSLTTAWAQQRFKSSESTKPAILWSSLCQLILIEQKHWKQTWYSSKLFVDAVLCSILLYNAQT